MEKYTGQRSLDDLKAYVEKSAGIIVKRAAEQETHQTQIKIEEAVLQLTTQSFDHAIENGITFVKFFAPWFVQTFFLHTVPQIKIILFVF